MTDTPKLNRWGKVSTPPLTEEQTARVRELLAEGRGLTAITREVGCSMGRVRMLQADHKRATAETMDRLLRRAAQQDAAILEALCDLLACQRSQQSIITAVRQELKVLNAIVNRKVQRLQKTDEENRNLRKELTALKRDLWKATGRSPR